MSFYIPCFDEQHQKEIEEQCKKIELYNQVKEVIKEELKDPQSDIRKFIIRTLQDMER